MDDAIPSISTAGVGSRFVSSNDVEAAKARRDEQWKAAYARLGQEPPAQPQEDAFDGRSLAEKLAANRAAKQEEWEERNKLGNQFRALEEDEVLFLDSVLEKQREEERLRKETEGVELKHFREAVAARETAANKPPPIDETNTASKSAPPIPQAKATTAPARKDPKKSLKGVLVKKKPKQIALSASDAQAAASGGPEKSNTGDKTDGDERQAKRRKVSAT